MVRSFALARGGATVIVALVSLAAACAGDAFESATDGRDAGEGGRPDGPVAGASAANDGGHKGGGRQSGGGGGTEQRGGAGGTVDAGRGGVPANAGGASSGGAFANGGAGGGFAGGGNGGISVGGSGGGGCDPVHFYLDADGDGVGIASVTAFGCAPPEDGQRWVQEAGDCNDSDARVFPGQEAHFDDPFADSNRPGGVSYDFDCNGDEAADPTNEHGAARSCNGALGLGCSGVGYLPNDSRSDAGANPLCGSHRLRTCSAGPFQCVTTDTEVTDGYRCR